MSITRAADARSQAVSPLLILSMLEACGVGHAGVSGERALPRFRFGRGHEGAPRTDGHGPKPGAVRFGTVSRHKRNRGTVHLAQPVEHASGLNKRGELHMTLTMERAERPATAAPARPKTSPKDVLKLAKETETKIVDLRFVDLPGTWQHLSIPIEELGEGLFVDGIGFDGSSIRGFQHIHESDMLLLPDANSAFIDPILGVKTLNLICDVVDPLTRGPYSRDPRYVAKKAEAFLPTTGIADTSFWGPEIEFYIFNSIRFDQAQNFGYYYIDSEEGIWNSGKDGGIPNLAHRPRYKEGYFPVPPADKLQDLRSKMVRALIDAGIAIEVHHHEVGTAGQTEIDMRFSTLVEMADKVLKYKYVTKNVAAPDPACNPYLAFSACLMAGLDGVLNKIEPPEPMNVDLYDLEDEEKRKIKQTPGSLEEVLDALDADRDFLMRGGVFTEDLIETWLGIKRQSAKEVALRPHPYEFYLYSDV